MWLIQGISGFIVIISAIAVIGILYAMVEAVRRWR